MQPETHYARSDDAWIAYQTSGRGLIDIVLVTGITMPIDTHYDLPEFARFVDRLGEFARVIRYDRRGMGLSDPVADGDPTLEQWVADGLAVCDAVGAERSTFMSPDIAGGQAALMMAAAHPSRVASLVLTHPTPCPIQRDDWPYGTPAGEVSTVLDNIAGRWLTGEVPDFARTGMTDAQRAWLVRAQRRGASPTTARMVFKVWFETDVRSVLPAITAPTLILHRPKASPLINRGTSEYLAGQIRGARLVELDGETAYLFLEDSEQTIAEIEEFLTGRRPMSVPEDRVFAALLFTDIVASTEQAAAVGDSRWRTLLDEHDAIVRTNLHRFRGRWVNPTGDGVLATFDGPARAVHCAQAIADAVRRIGVDVRAGIHAGEVVARGEDVAGIAVNIASRVAKMATAGEILVSRTVTDLVAGSGLEFDDRGEHALKGVSGDWRIYAVKG